MAYPWEISVDFGQKWHLISTPRSNWAVLSGITLWIIAKRTEIKEK
jgi:hypothetical protein